MLLLKEKKKLPPLTLSRHWQAAIAAGLQLRRAAPSSSRLVSSDPRPSSPRPVGPTPEVQVLFLAAVKKAYQGFELAPASLALRSQLGPIPIPRTARPPHTTDRRLATPEGGVNRTGKVT
jgi:hypothetical protein